jgi:hypothetical protein
VLWPFVALVLAAPASTVLGIAGMYVTAVWSLAAHRQIPVLANLHE